MAVGQPLRGFVGQSMAAKKKVASGYAEIFPAVGSYTFVAPKAGLYKFHLWGCGGNGTATPTAGASGSYAEATVFLSLGQAVPLAVDRATAAGSPLLGATTVTLPGRVISAGSANQNTPGVATGGDLNIPGNAPVGTTPAAAPGTTTMRGGTGSAGNPQFGGTPGGGAAAVGTTGAIGGDGFVVVLFVKP